MGDNLYEDLYGEETNSFGEYTHGRPDYTLIEDPDFSESPKEFISSFESNHNPQRFNFGPEGPQRFAPNRHAATHSPTPAELYDAYVKMNRLNSIGGPFEGKKPVLTECQSVVEHFKDCEICKGYSENRIKFYWMVILVLLLVIIFLMIKK
jgi:hypothetical protein